MSVLELLDTITGAYNNWVDGIRNDDPTFIDQIKPDLHLFSVAHRVKVLGRIRLDRASDLSRSPRQSAR
jgi:hypothetical protein